MQSTVLVSEGKGERRNTINLISSILSAVRARAILKIADSAPIPWCAKLSIAVQGVMGDKKIEQKMSVIGELDCQIKLSFFQQR